MIDALVGYARSELPNEACGYLVGDADGCVSRFVPITNAAASPTRFMFDPLEQLAAEQAIETAGDTVVGVAHSHPTGAATPSTTDVDDAGRYDPCGVFLCVSSENHCQRCELNRAKHMTRRTSSRTCDSQRENESSALLSKNQSHTSVPSSS